MKYIVIGNWKMNPGSVGEAKKLFDKSVRIVRTLKKTDVVLAVPFIYLPLLKSSSKNLFLGAQDVFWEEKGAYTGEISSEQLAKLGVSYVLVGHSERRALGDTDEIVNRKMRAVLHAGLTPVLCIGEHTHDAHGKYLSFLQNQIRSAFHKVSRGNLSRILVAYEPIWAIGKSAGDAMKSGEVHETVLYIQKILSEIYGREATKKVRIIYGAAVEADNTTDLIRNGNVRGLLPGHASLSAETFGLILRAVDKS
jgi:triosephosphate isomerase